MRIPERASEIVTGLQVRGECPRCGKRCYASRKTAKRAARLLRPGVHMRKYACGAYWHLSSMRDKPAALRRRDRGGLSAAA